MLVFGGVLFCCHCLAKGGPPFCFSCSDFYGYLTGQVAPAVLSLKDSLSCFFDLEEKNHLEENNQR